MRHQLNYFKRLCAADTPLLRARFTREFALDRNSTYRSAFWERYEQWLREHGVEPETGRMTKSGLAFFRSCVEDNDRSKRFHQRQCRTSDISQNS
jgi:hypothetical protein